MAGALIIFFTGLIDDLYGLSPKRKFLGQAIACVVTMGVGHLSINTLGNLFGLDSLVFSPWLAVPFTVVAVIGVVNAFNLMDGLDGLAGGISTIALSAFIILGYLSGNHLVTALSAALLGGVLGFLKDNLYPARMFMGDTGSMLLGFIIAFLSISLTQAPGVGVQPVVPLLVLGLPIADTIRVMGHRLLKGKSPFLPDRNHIHHRFLDMGFKHRYTVIIIYGISVFWASFAVLCHRLNASLLLVSYMALSMAFCLFMVCLRRNRERLSFMEKDSSAGIRSSVTYRRLSCLAGYTTPVILALTFAYLMLAALFSMETSFVTTKVGVSLFCGILGLLYMTWNSRNDFFLAMLATVAVLITYVLNQNEELVNFYGIPLHSLDNIIQISLFILVGLRFIFHDRQKPFLSSIDVLVLGIGILLVITVPSIFGNFDLADIITRGIVLFLAMKASMDRNRLPSKFIVGSVLAALMFIIVRGYVSS
jgi:UDP-GlcNAc:undecaprenyl-phosphate GlcNAc-1-phosphate transferase